MRRPLLLWLVLPALAGAAVLANDTYRLPPGEWRSLHFPVAAVPARVTCRFEVLAQPGAARVVLLSVADLQRFASHQSYDYLAATGEQSRGAFNFDLAQSGAFAVLLINSSASATTSPVELFVAIGSVPPARGPAGTYLSPSRRLATISISVAGFLLLLVGSAARLLRAMRRAQLVD